MLRKSTRPSQNHLSDRLLVSHGIVTINSIDDRPQYCLLQFIALTLRVDCNHWASTVTV